MAVKVGTGVLLAALALVGILWGPFWLMAPLVGIVILGAQLEFLRLSDGQLSALDLSVALAGGAVVLGTAALGPKERLMAWLLVAVALAGIAVLLWVLATPLRGQEEMPKAAARALWMLAGLLYIPLLGSGWIVLMREEMGPQGRALVLLAGFVTWLNDTMAYFGGKTMGRHRMYPAVSPNKTWEGSVWGMIGSLGGGLGVAVILLPDLSLGLVATYALTGGVLAQCGDLMESVFKRAAGVKDSAGFLPGHGGFLDRIDAFLFVIPWTLAWFLVWFPIGR